MATVQDQEKEHRRRLDHGSRGNDLDRNDREVAATPAPIEDECNSRQHMLVDINVVMNSTMMLQRVAGQPMPT